jgi:hypothetical protein
MLLTSNNEYVIMKLIGGEQIVQSNHLQRPRR